MDKNKDKHAFYVEESYVIPWMYPYMTPYGIILKINHDTLAPPSQDPQLWKQIVDRDTAYWDKLCADFAGRREFPRDTDAQKTFSKLRSAIGGLYAYHHMVPQAEYAFKQALNLCPESPEANFRLAQLYIEQGRVDDALAVRIARIVDARLRSPQALGLRTTHGRTEGRDAIADTITPGVSVARAFSDRARHVVARAALYLTTVDDLVGVFTGAALVGRFARIHHGQGFVPRVRNTGERQVVVSTV